MFPLECIGSIKWTAEYAVKLRKLRGKVSRREILARLIGDNVSISPEMFRKIEYAEAKTITPDLFVALCNAYNVHFSAIIPCVRIGIPDTF